MGRSLFFSGVAILGLMLAAGSPWASADAPQTPSQKKADSTNEAPKKAPQSKYTTLSIRGRIVWMSEALKRRFGVETDPDAAHRLVALETRGGRLYPIVKDARGRGFMLDARLHKLDLELFVRRHNGSPMVQVIRVFSLRGGKKYALDYWCDICAIPMFELKECECCQGPIRFRERLVSKDGVVSEEADDGSDAGSDAGKQP